MLDFWNQPWFGAAVAVAIGLPVLIVVLTELIGWQTRKGGAAAKPLRLLRNLVLPVAALLVLMAYANEVTVDFTWIRVVATVFGFLVILLVLSAFNVVLFGNARPGTWRDRLPSIFIDIARLLLIVVGLAVLFSWVWDADVGGLFAALGVTSIVIGLALQGAIGSVVSGLLLLFEQPFRLGDWLDTGSVRGRVVEVNWRAVHIETEEGIQIVPNASLADSSFTNLSRTPGAYFATTSVAFAEDDAPHAVLRLLRQVAADNPLADPQTAAAITFQGKGAYHVGIPVVGPASADDALAVFASWLWYAARRSGLTLNGSKTDPLNAPENIRRALIRIASTLRIPLTDIDGLIERCSIERYAAGEIVQREAEVATAIRVVVDGIIRLSVIVPSGEQPLTQLDEGEYVGQTALTRERTLSRATAATPLTVLRVPVDVIDALVQQHPALAKEIGQTIDRRRKLASDAIAAAAEAASLLRIAP
jgi:small-conductance mechanosensitive channel